MSLYILKGIGEDQIAKLLSGILMAFGLTDNFSVYCSMSGHPTIGTKSDFIGGGRIKIAKDRMIVYTHSGWFSNITREEAYDIAIDVRDIIQKPFKISVV